MFVQIIHMQAPSGEIAKVRQLIEGEYIPAIRNRAGFISAHLLEKIDDRDTAELIVYWDSQADVENFHKTETLMGSTHSIAARIPGMRVQKESYIAKVAVKNSRQSVV